MKEKVLAALLTLALMGGAGYWAVTSADAHGDRSDPGGIPDDNPSHHDEDGDGECEKGETIIKTTPSGRQVRVPCHAGGNGHDDGDRDDGDGNDADDADDDDDDDEGERHDRGNGNGHGTDSGD